MARSVPPGSRTRVAGRYRQEEFPRIFSDWAAEGAGRNPRRDDRRRTVARSADVTSRPANAPGRRTDLPQTTRYAVKRPGRTFGYLIEAPERFGRGGSDNRGDALRGLGRA